MSNNIIAYLCITANSEDTYPLVDVAYNTNIFDLLEWFRTSYGDLQDDLEVKATSETLGRIQRKDDAENFIEFDFNDHSKLSRVPLWLDNLYEAEFECEMIQHIEYKPVFENGKSFFTQFSIIPDDE
jgi:hypothetical protein